MKTFFYQKLIFLAVLISGPCFAVESDPREIPESELAALEKPFIKPSTGELLSWDTLAARLPFLHYFDEFEHPGVKPDENATPAENGRSVKPVAASAVGSAVTFGSTVSIAGSASPFAKAPGNWFLASVALDILSGLNREPAEVNARRIAISPLQKPSLFLVRHVQAETDDELYAKILLGQEFILGLGIECVPAYWRASGIKGVEYGFGIGTSNFGRSRAFVCGLPPTENLSNSTVRREAKGLSVVRTIERDPVLRFALTGLDDMSRMGKLLGVKEGDEKRIAAILFDRIKSKLTPEWTAIYTAPNADGKWTVTVANNGNMVEYPAPVK